MIIVYFLTWTFILYWIHRIIHKVSFLQKYHNDHHKFINQFGMQGWKWNNLFLFNDTKSSTIDLYITEVIPTFIFSWVTGQWWIFIFYYIWAAILQESLEHNKNLNLPLFTFGKWHLIHHKNFRKNYGLFFPIWDIIFNTYRHVDKRK